ncbi:MAG: hypothetical protein A2418_01305 [Candidatus Brennerbacteria bacterium RIFOXYC1_FULL_41_11]|uniref:Type II secretion system protein GspI C-terminal domain-containing protein n=1 Tax=Candidatus Brennerbacteria bacterium RIFOXYD1_FULL_41_16 TaxID=1797529 RepID=A0A1G1XK69_9BACT|nr:MAG: hypothetical protein A2418_01305 [Candidatus Brennerbacteria bacterium RIFOXYC1_FULL_41_11]OGY40493.1 MAG: hypothetical protein A2570_01965 [Candidatus Brennerbacteria bacterium RIFOXYD1_FULL_41_16]
MRLFQKRFSGYVALTSVIVISFLVMIIVFAASFSGFYLRENISDDYSKAITRELSEACAHLALLKLSQNKNYLGDETINVNSDVCLIRPVQSVGGTKEIKTSANWQGLYTNLKIIVFSTTLELISWEEE